MTGLVSPYSLPEFMEASSRNASTFSDNMELKRRKPDLMAMYHKAPDKSLADVLDTSSLHFRAQRKLKTRNPRHITAWAHSSSNTLGPCTHVLSRLSKSPTYTTMWASTKVGVTETWCFPLSNCTHVHFCVDHLCTHGPWPTESTLRKKQTGAW
jgi:hypothetical protein